MTNILIFASSNKGKLAEFSSLLQQWSITLSPQAEFGVEDAAETGRSFVENAIIKARHASQCTGLPALADDSGLVVPALDGAPGIYSSRYAGKHGDNAANNAKLLAAMQGKVGTARNAYFHCSLILMRSPNDPSPLIAEGSLQGYIADSPAGDKGFGYDPIVCPIGSNKRIAQLQSEEKNSISHRAQACTKLLTQIHQQGLFTLST